MREYLDIGSAPAEETCAAVGDPGYKEQARLECRTFIGQLIRMFGDPPDGSALVVQANPHDFGTYYSVAAKYTTNEGMEWAFKVERSTPSEWDDQSRILLGLPLA